MAAAWRNSDMAGAMESAKHNEKHGVKKA